MRFVSLSSGSSGNSTYIGSAGTHILIDAGCSRKRIIDGLNSLDVDLPDINGIFITHEHSDHIAALRLILKNMIFRYTQQPAPSRESEHLTRTMRWMIKSFT